MCMIIKDNVIGALEIGAGHRIAAVPSRLEHRCLELGEKGNKRFVVAEADTNRENFGKKADRLLKYFGSAVLGKDSNNMGFFSILGNLISHQNTGKEFIDRYTLSPHHQPNTLISSPSP